MKVAALAVLAAMLLFAPVASAVTQYENAQKATHKIYQEDAIGNSKTCSATAIGPHALLTASHCEMPSQTLAVDGIQDVHIITRARDGNDHSIYLVDITFDNVAPVNESLPKVGDEVFMFGNPGGFTNMLRKGYVMLVQISTDPFGKEDGDAAQIAYDMNSYFGDSGAAIFNSEGEVIDVLSTILSKASEPDGSHREAGAGLLTFKFTACLQLQFSPELLKQAAEFHKNDLHNDFTHGR